MPSTTTKKKGTRSTKAGSSGSSGSSAGRSGRSGGSKTRTTQSGKSHVEKTLSREDPHTHRTAKIVELVCSSSEGFEDAIRNGVEDASKSIHGITGCDVRNFSVSVRDGKIVAYKVDLKLAFGVEQSPRS